MAMATAMVMVTTVLAAVMAKAMVKACNIEGDRKCYG